MAFSRSATQRRRPLYAAPQQPYYPRIDPSLLMMLQFSQAGSNAQNEARQANESRYNDILKLFGDTRGRVMDGLSGLGDSLINDANRNWDQQQANQLADLAERGMSGSTARAGIQSRVEEGRNSEINRIRDQLNQQIVGADERFSDKAGGVMERRTDSYPDLNWLTSGAGQFGGFPPGLFGSLFGMPQQQPPTQSPWGNLFGMGGQTGQIPGPPGTLPGMGQQTGQMPSWLTQLFQPQRQPNSMSNYWQAMNQPYSRKTDPWGRTFGVDSARRQSRYPNMTTWM